MKDWVKSLKEILSEYGMKFTLGVITVLTVMAVMMQGIVVHAATLNEDGKYYYTHSVNIETEGILNYSSSSVSYVTNAYSNEDFVRIGFSYDAGASGYTLENVVILNFYIPVDFDGSYSDIYYSQNGENVLTTSVSYKDVNGVKCPYYSTSSISSYMHVKRDGVYEYKESATCSFPVYSVNSVEEAWELYASIVSGDISYGDIFGDSVDVNELETDFTFALRGFTADNTITTSWSGTTNADYVTEDAFVAVRFCYQTAGLTDYLYQFPLTDGSFTIPWDDVQIDGDILTRMDVLPVGAPSDSIFGAYVNGRLSTVYFNGNGEVTSSGTATQDFVQSSAIYDSSLDLVGLAYQETSDIPIHHRVTWENLDSYDSKTYIDVYADIAWKRIATEKQTVYQYKLTSTRNPILATSGEWEVEVTYPWKTYFEANDIDYSAFTSQWTDTLYFQVRRYDYDLDVWKVSKIRYIELKTQTTGTVDNEASVGDVIVDSDTGDWELQEPDSFTGDGSSTTVSNKDYLEDWGLSEGSTLADYFENLGTVFINGSKSLVAAVGQVPAMVNNVFLFLPSSLVNLMYFAIIIAVVLRILGR